MLRQGDKTKQICPVKDMKQLQNRRLKQLSGQIRRKKVALAKQGL